MSHLPEALDTLENTELAQCYHAGQKGSAQHKVATSSFKVQVFVLAYDALVRSYQ